MKKRILTVLALAAAHLAVSKIIVAVTMQIDMFAGDAGWAVVALGKSLIVVTRILYFPIITLSLYSRHWFPGDWIYVPMGANSLLWGIGIAIVLWFWPKASKSR